MWEVKRYLIPSDQTRYDAKPIQFNTDGIDFEMKRSEIEVKSIQYTVDGIDIEQQRITGAVERIKSAAVREISVGMRIILDPIRIFTDRERILSAAMRKISDKKRKSSVGMRILSDSKPIISDVKTLYFDNNQKITGAHGIIFVTGEIQMVFQVKSIALYPGYFDKIPIKDWPLIFLMVRLSFSWI